MPLFLCVWLFTFATLHAYKPLGLVAAVPSFATTIQFQPNHCGLSAVQGSGMLRGDCVLVRAVGIPQRPCGGLCLLLELQGTFREGSGIVLSC